MLLTVNCSADGLVPEMFPVLELAFTLRNIMWKQLRNQGLTRITHFIFPAVNRTPGCNSGFNTSGSNPWFLGKSLWVDDDNRAVFLIWKGCVVPITFFAYAQKLPSTSVKHSWMTSVCESVAYLYFSFLPKIGTQSCVLPFIWSRSTPLFTQSLPFKG